MYRSSSISLRFALPLLALALVFTNSLTARAQGKITSPKEQFGFNIGDDYQLANYTQLVDYWKKLAHESDRMKLVEIGKTAEGRTMWMAIISAPENLKKLDHYRDIARRLAHAEGLTDDQARTLAAEGKAVVWIDGGLHANEVLGAQQLMEMVHQMVSRSDPETLRLLHDDILLAVCVNPDGLELVANWYMRESNPLNRNLGGLPRLYQKYIGHDNNRDFYMVNQPETEAINHVLYLDWFPQIVYNHHQTGPAGTVLFAPPFRDPFNYYCDPLIPLGIDLVGAAMNNRFVAEGKPGATMRSGSPYSTWWNGGLRTTAYFHNMIGLLTESIGNPTPTEIPFLPARQLPKGDLPFPVPPGLWHFKQSIDYSITANRAVMDIASKYREDFLFNIYRMGKNSIERGSRDNWTIHPKMIAEVEAAIAKDSGDRAPARRPAEGDTATGQAFARGVPIKYYDLLHKPEERDARVYIIPSTQADFATAVKFVNTLIKNGITVDRATAEFQANGKTYPAGSFVIKAAQAFRPHILDMFEPQDHPDDIPFPGGPPTPPYDNAGWTLAYQMGVVFDRVLDEVKGPFAPVSGLAAVAPASIVGSAAPVAGFLLSHQVNDSFVAINRLLADGEDVYWLKSVTAGADAGEGPGAIYVPAKTSTRPKMERLAHELGLKVSAVASAPIGEALKLRPMRVGLWDRYGGSIPSGWTRWLLEKFDFKFSVVFPPALDAGNLIDKYDVLIFPDGGIPLRDVRGGDDFNRFGGDPAKVPAEYRDELGAVSVGKTIPQLKKFLDAGGTIITIGNSTSMAYHAGLPITNALVEKTADGSERGLPREKFYIPGSLLRVRVDNTDPIAYGVSDKLDVVIENSPAFRLRPEATLSGVKPVAWFDTDSPLRSGWALGQRYLRDSVSIVDAQVGKGKLLIFGPEITYRGQPHASFKFLFNGIYYGGSQQVTLR